ncbi:MAG TPA: hypothetical protein VFI34_08425 [Candidatus Limnocylindrales bacterium]|nr:hypothetical protein [Candidatus Limnocylindrales bacterium]
MTARSSWWGDALRGAVAGTVATWLMDQVTTGVQATQSAADRAREEAARPNGRGAVANLVERLDGALGTRLDRTGRVRAETAVHYALGALPGALYGIARGRLPLVGGWAGAAYGGVLWAVNDEALNTRLGLAGPFAAYPLSAHWRGFVGHVALGAATDSGLDILGAA